MIYSADAALENVHEVFSVKLSDFSVTKLSLPTPVGHTTTVDSLILGGGKVFYVTDQDTDNRYEIYRVNPDGTGREKIYAEPSLSYTNNLGAIQFSPSSDRLIYSTNEGGSNFDFEMWSLDLTQSAPITPTKLNIPIVANGNVGKGKDEFKISSDGQTVFYYGDIETDGSFEYYAVNVDGTNHRKLSGTMTAWESAVATPDLHPMNKYNTLDEKNQRILYSADKEVDGKVELYISNFDGTGNVKVWSPAHDNGDVVELSARWTPNSEKIVFMADHIDDEVISLYSVNADGSDLTQINRPIDSRTSVYNYSNLVRVMKDSYNVLFLLNDAEGDRHLYLSGVTGASSFGNNAPSLNRIVDFGIIQNQTMTDADVGGELTTDIDRDGDPISYKCYFDTTEDGSVANTNLCSNDAIANGSGFSFSASTGVISGWTPSDLVDYEFKIEGCDDKGLCDSVIFKLSVTPPCGGTRYAGACWYFANSGCDTFCSSHGGATNFTIDYVGSGGTESNCKNVMAALGMTVVTISNSGAEELGCHRTGGVGTSFNRRTTGTTTLTAIPANTFFDSRVCSCAE